MISVHYYSPWDFCGEETGTITQWGASATNPSRKSTWGQEDYLDAQLRSTYDRFVTQGYPVVVGEIGSIDKTAFDSTNHTYREAFAGAVAAAAKKYGAVPIIWDNGYNGPYGFGLFNRSTLAITQQGIIHAIMSVMNANKIRNVATGLYIDGMGRNANGSIAGQWGNSASNNQRWIMEAFGGNYRIKNVATGLYLDGGGSTANGSDLKMWSSSASASLQWRLVNP